MDDYLRLGVVVRPSQAEIRAVLKLFEARATLPPKTFLSRLRQDVPRALHVLPIARRKAGSVVAKTKLGRDVVASSVGVLRLEEIALRHLQRGLARDLPDYDLFIREMRRAITKNRKTLIRFVDSLSKKDRAKFIKEASKLPPI